MKILKFGAVWCPGCITMRKVWKELESDFELDTEYFDLDVDLEAVNKWEIGNKVPVFIFLKDGKEVRRFHGEKSYEEVLEIINEVKAL